MLQSHDVLNDGHLVVVRATDELEPGSRNDFGELLDPPRLYVVGFDLETLMPFAERISFKAARALAPEKYAAAVAALQAARAPKDPE